MQVALVAAVAENGVIGRDGEMPWHHPEDLAHFKDLTMGHPVVMGRVTFESIVEDLGGPLPGRTNVVLTGRALDLPEGAIAVGSVEDALDAARAALDANDADEAVVYVAGGATVYEQFLPLADRIEWTEIPGEPDGDTFFPDVDWDEWTAVAREERGDLAFVTYDRTG